MGAFQVKAEDEVADRASAAIEQYRANHDLANRGDALKQLLPLLERAAVEGGADPEAEKMIAQVKSMTASIEVEVQALATRVTTARAAERAAAAADLDNAEQVAQAATEQANRLRDELDTVKEQMAEIERERDDALAQVSDLTARLDAALGLKHQLEQACGQ